MSSAITASVVGAAAGAYVSSSMSDGGGGGQVTGRESRYTPAQMQLIDRMSGRLQQETGQGVNAYPGQMAAEPSALQSQLFSILEQGREPGEPGLGEQLTRFGTDQLTQTEEYDPEAAQDYWQQSFVEPARQNFQEETMPGLREQFAGQNALSSGGFNRAVADSAANMETQLGAKLGELTYRGKQDFENRQLQERGLGLKTLDQILNEMSGTGQTQRQIEQAGLGEEYQKWQTSRDYNNPWLQNYLGTTLGTSPYDPATTIERDRAGFWNRAAPAMGKAVGQGASKGVQGLYDYMNTGNSGSTWTDSSYGTLPSNIQ